MLAESIKSAISQMRMRLRAGTFFLLLLSACASAPPPPGMLPSHAFVPTSPSDPGIRLVSAPMDPGRHGSRIAKADLEQARALLSRARNDLEPSQAEALERKLAAAERAFERFSNAAQAKGQAAEVVRGTESAARVGRARALAEALPRVGPLLALLVLLYPSSTASAELDHGPEWSAAQREYEACLKDVSEASWQLMDKWETQPRTVKAPARTPSPQSQSASALLGEEDPRCKPIPWPRHLGGHDLHNECADKLPDNSFPGGDVYVNGKGFDALQLATRTLWEVKTDGFEKQPPRSQQFFVRMKLPEIQREKKLAEACGYNFAVGVKSAEHKALLESLDDTLAVVLMNWC